jgi:DNA-dependent RNA polymerase auxiliary subunit epsilon
MVVVLISSSGEKALDVRGLLKEYGFDVDQFSAGEEGLYVEAESEAQARS